MRVTHVQTFEILAVDQQVDVVVTPTRNQRARRTHVGVQLERFTQPHIAGAIALAGRRLQRPFERKTRAADAVEHRFGQRSEEHTSELQSLLRISYAVLCLKKKKPRNTTTR